VRTAPRWPLSEESLLVTDEKKMTHPAEPGVPAPEEQKPESGRRLIEPPPREELERVRSGEPEALGKFFDRYFPMVFGLVARLLSSRTEAEDATQDVFLKVYRAIERLDPERDPGPWLTTIAYNVCRDRWRSSAGRMERQSSSVDDRPELAHHLRDERLDPQGELLADERERIVQEALLELPEAAREVIVLHDYEGLSHDRIAGMLDASHAAIRKRYSRAVKALGEILQGRLEG
jgi:RNA polymerase sigma-70 factor (ECF subfamily)